ncbi:hypothetical protein FB451DRAFT_1448735 [Mycena latifolia]|nr:hypothetical protein FB451DRAFT_1448735 [Mycena latifolia]
MYRLSYEGARAAAHNALLRDPSLKNARFWRGVAYQGLGRLPESILDLYSILTTDPNHSKARPALMDALERYNFSERVTLSPATIMEIDTPPAHSSSLRPELRQAAPSILRPAPSNLGTTILPQSAEALFETTMVCGACGVAHRRKNVKTCAKCKTVAYCNVNCQRSDWPQHKKICATAGADSTLLGLSDRLLRRPYVQDILEHYAMISQGLLSSTPPACPAMLIIHVGLSSLPAGGRFSSRLCIQQISTVPVVLLEDNVVREYDASRRKLLFAIPDARPIGMRVHPNSGRPAADGFGQIAVTSARPTTIEKASQPGFKLPVHSVSTAQDQLIPMDLDSLFQYVHQSVGVNLADLWFFSALEAEIQDDTDNYYQLRQ